MRGSKIFLLSVNILLAFALFGCEPSIEPVATLPEPAKPSDTVASGATLESTITSTVPISTPYLSLAIFVDFL